MASRPLAQGLYTIVGEKPRLLGGRSKSDGTYAFPLPQGPQGELFDAVELASEGTLWSYTVQRFRPKTPYAGPGDETTFKPYAVGYVELAGQIIVESPLKVDDFASLKIGMPMSLTLIPFRQDEDGTEVLTYAFQPTA
jgi:uncharacterized OB-fold protein